MKHFPIGIMLESLQLPFEQSLDKAVELGADGFQMWFCAPDPMPRDEFLQKRFRGAKPDPKELKRATDALLRRGHSYHDIQAGLRRYEASLSLEQTQEDTWEDME